MRIGIFGGSFDPIHIGHSMIANYASQSGVVDEVWIMVSRRNPLKPESTKASEKERLEMAKIVAEKCHRVKASDFEFGLPTPSYSYDTLKALKKQYPEDEFVMLIGSDSLQNLKDWKNYDLIIKDFGLLVYPRPKITIEEWPEGNVKKLEGCPETDISSTFIRKMIKEGKNINYFVPADVAAYIEKHRIYLKE